MISVSGRFPEIFHSLCGTSHTETSTNILERSGRVGRDAWVMGRSRTLVAGRVPYCGVSRRGGKSEKSVKSVKFGKFGKRHRSMGGHRIFIYIYKFIRSPVQPYFAKLYQCISYTHVCVLVYFGVCQSTAYWCMSVNCVLVYVNCVLVYVSQLRTYTRTAPPCVCNTRTSYFWCIWVYMTNPAR